MDWARWQPIYAQILEDFGYAEDADKAARDVLRDILGERIWADDAARMQAWMKARDAFRDAVRDREVWIVGAAATEADVATIPPGAPTLVTDGAARVALPRLRPLAIVTDLDGDVDAQAKANAEGVPLFVHAHGDNVEALREWLPRFDGIVWGTTQAPPLPPAWNHGGFTDGDRAACIAAAFGARSLVLVGFDFEAPVAKPGSDPALKKRKLAWARRIIDALPVPARMAPPAT